MIFYIATDQDGKKHVLTVEAEARKIDKNFVEVDQPNDKTSLKAMIQESYDHIFQLEQKISSLLDQQISTLSGPSPSADILQETRPLAPQGVARDGLPDVRPAWTAQQINLMFTRRSEHVQDICHAISRLSGPDLGYVAFQVAAQMVQPITVIEEKSDGQFTQ
jgi:hypothetical protein